MIYEGFEILFHNFQYSVLTNRLLNSAKNYPQNFFVKVHKPRHFGLSRPKLQIMTYFAPS